MKVTSLRYLDAKFHHPSLGASPPVAPNRICLPPELLQLLHKLQQKRVTLWLLIATSWIIHEPTDGWPSQHQLGFLYNYNIEVYRIIVNNNPRGLFLTQHRHYITVSSLLLLLLFLRNAYKISSIEAYGAGCGSGWLHQHHAGSSTPRLSCKLILSVETT